MNNNATVTYRKRKDAKGRWEAYDIACTVSGGGSAVESSKPPAPDAAGARATVVTTAEIPSKKSEAVHSHVASGNNVPAPTAGVAQGTATAVKKTTGQSPRPSPKLVHKPSSGDGGGGGGGSSTIAKDAAICSTPSPSTPSTPVKPVRAQPDAGVVEGENAAATLEWKAAFQTPSRQTSFARHGENHDVATCEVSAKRATDAVNKWRASIPAIAKPSSEKSEGMHALVTMFKEKRDDELESVETRIQKLKEETMQTLEKDAIDRKIGFTFNDDVPPPDSEIDKTTFLKELSVADGSRLVLLNLSGQGLTNVIPIIDAIEQMPTLIILKMEQNRFVDVEPLAIALFGSKDTRGQKVEDSAGSTAASGGGGGSGADSGGDGAAVAHATEVDHAAPEPARKWKTDPICTDLQELWLGDNPINDDNMRIVCNGLTWDDDRAKRQPKAAFNCKEDLQHLIQFRDRLSDIWSFHVPDPGHPFNPSALSEDLTLLEQVQEKEGFEAMRKPADTLIQRFADLSEHALAYTARCVANALKAPPLDKLEADPSSGTDETMEPRSTETRLNSVKLFLRLYVQAPLTFCTLPDDVDAIKPALKSMYAALVAPCVEIIRTDMLQTGSTLKENSLYQNEIRKWAAADSTGLKGSHSAYEIQMGQCRKEKWGGGEMVSTCQKEFWDLIKTAFNSTRPAPYTRANKKKGGEEGDGIFEIGSFSTCVQPKSDPLELLLLARHDMEEFNKSMESLVGVVNSSIGEATEGAILHLRPFYKALKTFGTAASHVPGTKGLFRVIEKSLVKKGADNSKDAPPACERILDVYGCIIECVTFGAMTKVLEQIKLNKKWEVLRVKNRLGKGFETGCPTTGGWQDIMVNVRQKGKSDACIFEIQIANQLMLTARKGMKGHASFVAFRGFDELMKYNDLKPLAIMVELDSSTADQILHVHKQIEDLLAKMKVLQKRKEEEDAQEMKTLKQERKRKEEEDTLKMEKLKQELAAARKEK